MAKKKIGPDHQLAAHIPFYRTRKFWAIVFAAFLIWSIVYTLLILNASAVSVFSTFTQLSFSLGALPTIMLLDGIVGEPVSFIVFYIIVSTLIYKTFRKQKVMPVYPIALTFVLVSGHIARVLLIGVI